MKRAVLLVILLGVALGAVMVWRHRHVEEAKPGDKPAEEKSADEATHVKHTENGQVIVFMSDEIQGNIGLMVAKPAAAQARPELKGYGRVLDPAALAALVTELASARVAFTASSREFTRLQTLSTQGNASERALQAAEAAAQRDQLAAQSAQDRLAWSWSKGVADQNDLPGFVQSLNSRNAALVRVDLPIGEALQTAPVGARLTTLSGGTIEAEFLGAASNVDPQTLGQGSIFLVKTNALRLLAGEPLTGYMKMPGEPLAGVMIPNEAVVRTEGASWVYIMNSGGASFTRVAIALDHPIGTAWFVTQGVTTNDYLVVTGAQILLSEESKASIKPD